MLLIGILTLTMLYALPGQKNIMSNNRYIQITTIIILLTSILTVNSLNIQQIGSKITIYSGLLNINSYNLFITIIITIFSCLILLILPIINNFNISKNFLDVDYKEDNNTINNIKEIILSNMKEYTIIVLIFLLGGLLLIYSSDFIIFIISLELQSFSLYILTILYKSRKATISGLKYFILGSLSSAIILLGISLIYSETGTFNFDSIYILIDTVINYNNNNMLIIGISLVIIGLLFKLGAAPLHFWSPDVYDNSKTFYTIWLNVMPKLTLITVLIQFIVGFNYTSSLTIINNNLLTENIISVIIYISCILSLVIGAVLGLSQVNLKRLFTYSTINHIGFMLLSLNNETISINALVFYLIQYTISTLTLFCIMIALSRSIKTDDNVNNNSNINSDVNRISSIVGLFYKNPLLTLCLSITMFSFSGIPPLNGFFSKFFVLEASLSLGNYFLSVIAIIVSVISAVYYLRIVMLMFNNNNSLTNKDKLTISYTNSVSLSNIHSNIIIILTLVQLLYMSYPNFILNSAQLLSLSLINS